MSELYQDAKLNKICTRKSKKTRWQQLQPWMTNNKSTWNKYVVINVIALGTDDKNVYISMRKKIMKVKESEKSDLKVANKSTNLIFINKEALHARMNKECNNILVNETRFIMSDWKWVRLYYFCLGNHFNAVSNVSSKFKSCKLTNTHSWMHERTHTDTQMSRTYTPTRTSRTFHTTIYWYRLVSFK